MLFRPLLILVFLALASTSVGSATRVMLTSDLLLWYRTDGNNSNDCLSDTAAGACRDPQGAATLASSFDLGGKTINIKHGVTGTEGTAPRTFTGRTNIPTMFGGGSVNFYGNPTPGYTTIDGNGEDCFWLNNVGTTTIGFADMRLTSSGGSGLINVSDMSLGQLIGEVDFGPAANYGISVHDQNAKFEILTASFKVSGDMTMFAFVYEGALIMENCTGTPVGVRSFYAFVGVAENGKVKTTGCTFPTSTGNDWTGGNWTLGGGMRFIAYGGGRINTFNAGVNYFPGGQAGWTETTFLYR